MPSTGHSWLLCTALVHCLPVTMQDGLGLSPAPPSKHQVHPSCCAQL